jgi:hypothetical protein
VDVAPLDPHLQIATQQLGVPFRPLRRGQVPDRRRRVSEVTVSEGRDRGCGLRVRGRRPVTGLSCGKPRLKGGVLARRYLRACFFHPGRDAPAG